MSQTMTQGGLPLFEATNLDEHIRAHQSDAGFKPKRKCQPTQAMPGTAAKVEVLRQRLESGQPLWHPKDPVFIEKRRIFSFPTEIAS